MTATRMAGEGNVLYGEEWVATVRYSLAPTARIGRATGMDGVIETIQGGPLAVLPRNYILCLADGREVAFIVTEMPDISDGARYTVGTVGPVVEHSS